MVSLLLAVALIQPVNVYADDVPDEMKNVPQDVVTACEKYGKEYNIQPEFLEAVAYYESNYRPNVSNKSGTCHGLMQISYSAHDDRMRNLGVSNIFDVDGNIHTAADYLGELFEIYDDPALVLAYYNGQSKDRIERLEVYGEMSTYAENILWLSAELERLHGK